MSFDIVKAMKARQDREQRLAPLRKVRDYATVGVLVLLNIQLWAMAFA